MSVREKLSSIREGQSVPVKVKPTTGTRDRVFVFIYFKQLEKNDHFEVDCIAVSVRNKLLYKIYVKRINVSGHG